MAENIDELYNELTSDPRFKSMFESQTEFEQYLAEDPAADVNIENVFGVKTASEYLKKKAEPIIQNLGKENSSLQSLSVGPTKTTPAETETTEGMVAQPPMGGDQNLGVLGLGEENVLEPLGYGKAMGVGPQTTKPPGKYSDILKSSGKLKKDKEGSGIWNRQMTPLYNEIVDLAKNPNTSNFILDKKVKQYVDLYKQIEPDDDVKDDFNTLIKVIKSSKTLDAVVSADGVKIQKKDIKTAPKEQPLRIATYIEPKKEVSVKVLPNGGLNVTTEKFVPPPPTEKELGIINYLDAYDRYANDWSRQFAILSDPSREGEGFDDPEYLQAKIKEEEGKVDKLIEADVYNFVKGLKSNVSPDAFDNPALVSQTRNVWDVDWQKFIPKTETVQNEKRRLLYEDGLYGLDNAKNFILNTVYLENQVDKLLNSPTGPISDKVLNAFNEKRKVAGLDPYSREQVAGIFKQRFMRIATTAAQQKIDEELVNRRLFNADIFKEDVERVNKDLNGDIKVLTANTQKTINDLNIKLSNGIKSDAEILFSEVKIANDNMYANYLQKVKNTPMTQEQLDMEYKNYLDFVSQNATMLEERINQLEKKAQEDFLAAKVQIDNTAKAELDKIKNKYGIISDKDEKNQMTTAIYRKYRDAYKKAYDDIKSEEQQNSNAMGWRLWDITKSRTAGLLANSIEALSAAVGYEDNPFVDMLKYLNTYQAKNKVDIKPFSKVIDEDGFFSVEAIKSAAQNTVQQAPNLVASTAATILTKNPYIGGGIGFVLESTEIAGENYKQSFEKFGSIVDAENAAADAIRTQTLMAPLYVIEMLPYVKGFLSKITPGTGVIGFGKKFAFSTALEIATETPVEITQNYLNYKATTENPMDFATYARENGINTSIDVAPAVAVLGGGSALMETYSERQTELAKSRVQNILGRLGMSQTIADAVQVIGDKGALIIPEYLYRTGQINAEELKDMRRAFEEVVKALPNAKTLVQDQDAQKYFVSLSTERAMFQKKLDESKDELEKRLLGERIKSIDKKLGDVAAGKPLQLTKIKFKDGSSIVVSNEQMLNEYLKNPKMVENLASEDITVETQDPAITKIVEEKKKSLEKELEEATDKGAKQLGGVQTIARETGATLEEQDKLNEVAAKATSRGQENTNLILNEAVTLQRALEQVAPGARIVFMNSEEFSKVVPQLGGKKESAGNFAYTKNEDGSYSVEVQINLDKANSTTLAHEVGHVILLRTLGSDPKLFNEMRTKLRKTIEGTVKNDVLRTIDTLVNEYKTNEQAEEFLVELTATLKLNAQKLEISTLEKIAKVISDFVAYVTGGQVQIFNEIQTRADFADFINGMADTLSTGEIAKPLQRKIDAVQEQEAGQVPVQPEAGVSQEVAEGKPQAEPQVAAEQGQEEVIRETLENPLTTADVVGRVIEPGFELFDEDVKVDVAKSKVERGPSFASKSEIIRNFNVTQDDFVNPEVIDGKNMLGFMGDLQLAGSIVSPTGVELEGRGGPGFVKWANRNLKINPQTGLYEGRAAVWASTFDDSTGKLANRMKKTEGALIGAQQKTGVLGNVRMLNYFTDELLNAIKYGANENEILAAINSPLDSTMQKVSLRKYLNIDGQFNSIEEMNAYLNPFVSKEEFKKRFGKDKNIDKVSYEFRTNYFGKIFNITNHKKFNIPSIETGKGYNFENTILEYANDPLFAEAGYGDFVGYMTYDPKTIRVERVKEDSDFYNPSYPFVITAEGVGTKFFNNFLDGRAIFYDAKPTSKTANQTPFGLRPKELAARAIMGAQPSVTFEAEKVQERQKGFESKAQLTQPTTGDWNLSLTQEQVDNVVGGDFGASLEEKVKEGKKHNTQIATTINTYNKWANWLEQNVPNFKEAKVLDIGAGLGHIHKAFKGKNNNTESYEPFYDKVQYRQYAGVEKPNYSAMDASDVPTGQYDVVVNNAVLNVVPADIRESIVNTIGEAMKPGGIAIINAMDAGYIRSLINKIESGQSKNIKLSDTEVFVRESGKNTYQKGWTPKELQSYVQDVLGPNFTVERAPGPITSMTTVLVRKNAGTQGFKSKAQLDFTQIRPEFDNVMNQTNGNKVAAYTALVEKGYTPKRIKEAIGLYDFDETAFKQAQSQIAINTLDKVGTAFSDRQELIKQAINDNLGNVESIYEDLTSQGYSNLEIFTAARDMDFLSPQDLVDLFGAEYRQTVQNAINTKTQYPADFLDELEADARSLKVTQTASEITDVIRETGIGLVDSAVTVDMFLEYLKTNGFDQIAIALTNGVKQFAQDRGMFDKTADWVDMVNSGQVGNNMYSPEAINYAFSVSSELFSQAGRILQMARFFNEANTMGVIEKTLANNGVVLSEQQRKTLEGLVNDYKAAQKDNKTKLEELQTDWSDNAYNAFWESEKAVGMATIRVAQFLEARKPIFWNERITSGAARGLLNLTTTVLSFTANIENNIYSTNFVVRAIQKLRDSLGSGIKGNTLSISNWQMARKLTSKRMWFDMNKNAMYGVMDTSNGLNKYYDNLAQVNFFRDVKWVYNFSKTMVGKVLNRDFDSMTPEEQADAFDLTLVKLKNGDIELRDGKTYTFARSLAWTLGTGPGLAIARSNPWLLLNTGGPLLSEVTGRAMAYGGDIAFGYMAAQRAMIDYFKNIQGTRFQDGIFDTMIKDANGNLDEKAIRAMSQILLADGELYARFEEEGLKRTLLANNPISGIISLGRGQLRKKIRNLYNENRVEIGGSTMWREARREFLSGKGLLKNSLQMLDVGLFTLMPFTKVPVNFIGSAITKVVPAIAMGKYAISEGTYQYKWKQFNKEYPIGKKLKNDKERRDYEKAKIDLFSAKRQATYDAAQVATSFAIYGFAMSAVQAGAILTDGGGDPEKEKALKTFGLRGGLYNASLHWEYLTSGMPANFLARRGGYAKQGDKIMSTANAGFLGYAFNLYGSTNDALNRQEADNVTSLLNTQKGALSVLLSSSLSSSIEDLPMFQGVARIGQLLNDLKNPESTKNAWNNFASGSLSTSMAVFFPSFFSFMSKGNAEMVQSANEINTRMDNPNWPVLWGDITLRVVQKLNRNVSFNPETRNEFYEAAIGPFGEDLSYRVTVGEPGTARAFIQSVWNPFSFRKFSSPAKEQQKEIQVYRQSMEIYGGLVNLSLIYNQMTGRDYEWTATGPTSGMFGIITNPMRNKFTWAQEITMGGEDAPNIYKGFTYQLPNDLYRQELKLRGEFFRSSLERYGSDINDVLVKVQTYIADNKIEQAKAEIVTLFNGYQQAMIETQKDYMNDYRNNREKQYLIKLKERNLLSKQEIQDMIKVGLADEEGFIK